ncbi:MAG: class I SAM-dependent methyltransferase [Candidatus Woesearchaeota archaeon]
MQSKEISKIYSNLAKEYNTIVSKKAKYTAHTKMHDLAKKHITKNATILDLGCGTGLGSKELLKKGRTIIGIDCAQGMLKEAQKLPFEKVILQDIEEPLKVKNDYFDAVLLIGVMEFIKNPHKLLKEIHTKLKKEGIVSIKKKKKISQKSKLAIKNYYKKDIEKIFKQEQYKILACKTFFGYNKQQEQVYYYGYILQKKA